MEKKWKQADRGYQYIQDVGNCTGIYANDGSGIVAFVFKKDEQDNAPLIAGAPETAAERDALKVKNAELVEALQFCQKWFERYAPYADINPSQNTVGELPMLSSVKAVLTRHTAANGLTNP